MGPTERQGHMAMSLEDYPMNQRNILWHIMQANLWSESH